MFKYPYSNFNETNLDWIMKTVKGLEPALDMVEQADAALRAANEASAEALRVAGEADAAVSTVTAQAAAAVQTANEAKTTAEQAASATIADGSVTEPKLGSDVISRFETDEADIITADRKADAAQSTANNALGAAGVAQRLANQANDNVVAATSTAAEASTTAAEAKQIAEQALAQSGGSVGNWILVGTSTGAALNIPNVAKELCLVCWYSDSIAVTTTIYVPCAALTASGAQFETANNTGTSTVFMLGVWITTATCSPSSLHNCLPARFKLYYR